MLKIYIDSKSGVPLYRQIVEQVKQLVKEQHLKPGEQIPAVREMAKWLQINPSTVARAYFDLKKAGVVTTSRRRGTIIARGADKLPEDNAVESKLYFKHSPTGDRSGDASQDNTLLAVFALHLAHWQIRRGGPENSAIHQAEEHTCEFPKPAAG